MSTPDQTAPEAEPFRFTEAAAEKIKSLVASSDEPALGLRVGVRGGGCSGFSYFMEIAPEGSVREGKDEVFEAFGAVVVVDRRSLEFLSGTELHWDTSLLGSSFKFTNPNARRSCGCGSSFAV